jgi:hypothetical protein
VRVYPTSQIDRLTPVSAQAQCGQYGRSTIWVSRNLLAQVHPIPPFDNLTAFNLMVDKMEELGLWLMYDMRR